MWQLWKARNRLYFEKIQTNAAAIWERAEEESDTWLELNVDPSSVSLNRQLSNPEQQYWQPPPLSFLKCNVAAAWDPRSKCSGMTWVVRDNKGEILFHSRRSFVSVQSRVEAELLGLVWATESLSSLRLSNIIVETSFLEAREVLLDTNIRSPF
ncbi:hypothetical protein Bca52824_017647 [Brassica carinata]|uniref:RNase H type-1 domain-containing protein n=1 Tax=Brassica carinata TaxID=52824 RepID=A0A8X7VNI7_BRACI|nr:hypothetical protein Bca52824_017647 [Brassica carinata]